MMATLAEIAQTSGSAMLYGPVADLAAAGLALSGPEPPPVPPVLFVMDVALVIGGVLLLVWVGQRALVRGGSPAQGDVFPARPNRLLPEYIAIPVLAFAGLQLAAGVVFGGQLNDPQRGQIAALFLGSTAQLVGGVVCVVLSGYTFEKRWAGFLLGDRCIGRDVVTAAGGLLAAFPICWAAAEASARVLQLLVPGFELPEHDVLRLLEQHEPAWWLTAGLWVSAVVIAPFAEEVFFRGICQTALNHLLRSPRWSIVIVGSLFGLSHYSQPQVILPLALLGIVLGYVYERRGSLAAPMIMHALFNLKTLIFYTLARQAA